MTIDEEIASDFQKTLEKDEVLKMNYLSNMGDVQTIRNYRKRKEQAQEAQKIKSENLEIFNQKEIEVCKNLIDNPHFQWWLLNILVPLTVMPKDENMVNITESIRRAQIEAMTYDKLVDRIMEKTGIERL